VTGVAGLVDLRGRIVLLTGASSGIGAATAAVLGGCGAHVIAHYGSSREGAERATSEIPESHRLLIQADLGEPGAARRLWDDAVRWQGRVDVVVNNAAVMPDSPVASSDVAWDRAWDAVTQVNVRAAADLMREAVGHFKERGGGVLITLSSWAAQQGSANPNLVAYAASKAALKAATQTVARAHARDGVMAYIVAPGVVDTGMSHRAAESQGGLERVTEALATGTMVPPTEVGYVVAFLATGVVRHLSGATLDLNGATYVR
jgi:NAD(P)-dependent dehydrogenase (short-subunit alcohol dehydrogenase family)